MPLLDPQARPREGLPGAIPQPQARRRPGALDTLAAAFRQSNLASSLRERLNEPALVAAPQTDYDPLDDIAGFEEYAARFLESKSPERTARIKQRIRSELADRDTLQRAGGWGLAASLGAGVVDPATVISMGIPVLGEARAARVGSLVLSQLSIDTASEVAFHGLQETRTTGESLINVGASTVLAGVLGTLATRMPRAELDALGKRLDAELRTPSAVNLEPPDSTAGAAQVARTTLADETLATGGQTLSKSIGQVSPAGRLLNSPSVNARRIVQELAETPELLEKNLRGVATPAAAETSLKRLQGAWWQAYQGRAELYRAYRTRMREAGEAPISRAEFAQEVAFAMRRADQSPIVEVARAAQRTRELIFEPLKRRAIRLGLLPEDVTVQGAESYLMRQYNVAKIRAQPAAWIETLTAGFERQGLDNAEAETLAYQVTRNILGSERGTLDLHVMDGIVPKSGRLAERELKLPDEVLEPWLVNDIDALSQAYLRTLGPEIEITERFGDRSLEDALSKAKDEYSVFKARAREAGDDRLLKQLTAREEADLRDLAAIRDRLYGHFGAPKDPSSFFVRAGRAVRALNYTRLLGGQVISAMTDTAYMMMKYGAPKMMASAARLATNLKALKLARTEARRMGIGLDLVLNTRGIALGDIGEYSSFAEQAFLRRASDVFSIASLQSPWNAVMKSWASVMSQDDVLGAAAKMARGKLLTKRQRARLAQLGLDEEMLQRIAAQASEHGESHSGLRFGNSDRWGDTRAAAAFESAILKETDIAIITPGVGDLPLVHSTEWGKALLQFKSFSLSATRRLTIPAAQGVAQGDLAMMSGLASAFGIGSLVYVLKQLTAGQPIETDPERFAMEMVDKSGLLAWTGDLIFPGLWQFGSDDLSRWSDRQPVETLLGPVAGTVGDIYASRWPAKALSGDLSAADVHKIRRLLPFQNLWYARRAINELEGAAADAAGAQ